MVVFTCITSKLENHPTLGMPFESLAQPQKRSAIVTIRETVSPNNHWLRGWDLKAHFPRW